jgi:hypothetical protein
MLVGRLINRMKLIMEERMKKISKKSIIMKEKINKSR